MQAPKDENSLLRSSALQNAQAIQASRLRAEEELVRTKEALGESEARLRAIFSNAGVGIALASIDGRFVDVNHKFSEILNYSCADLLTKSFAEITHPDDLPATLTGVQELLDGTRQEFATEKRYLRQGAPPVWSFTTVSLVRDASGQPVYFVGAIDDISSRKRTEAKLLEETRMLELLNETGRALAAELDLQAVIQAVTDAGTALTGAQFGAFFYNTTDAAGDALMLFTLSGAPREAFEGFGNPRATALFGPTFRGEPPIRCDDVLRDPRYGTMGPHQGMPPGHLPVRSYLAVPVRSRSGEVVGGLFFGHAECGMFSERSERLIVGVAAQAGVAIDNARMYDRSLRAAAEREALLESERAARTAAERLSALKDEFLATLSHELRTPLNAILGWARVLRTQQGDPANAARGLEAIERNARLQAQLVEDLLDMSRVVSGQLRLDVQPVQPAAFIQAAIETVAPSATAKDITLETQLDPAAGPVSGDPGRLQQVIWNLLSNAIKFTPNHGTVQVVLTRHNGHVEITVSDSGAGIKPDFLPHLFERFRQADASTTRRHAGLGLGLSIVKSLVELHGGQVSIRSDGEGQGTTVTVQLPRLTGRRTPPSGARPPARGLGPLPSAPIAEDLSGLTVLVVDDQADARALVAHVLEGCGAVVLPAGSAEEALQLVTRERPDVLISDIGMPDVDGFELLRRLRALGADRGGGVPAIALTAFARSEDGARVLEAGFARHVAKPFEPAALVRIVSGLTGRRSVAPD